VVGQVWDEGWTHHIPRLMVLANIASLLDVSPRELSDWFWVAYTDAYDWVVEPNVIAMGSYGVGDLMTTKPYVSGAGYINRMSDFCGDCAFDPKKNCPLTPMYWAYLERHKDALKDNMRMKLPLRSLEKRKPERRQQDKLIFETVHTALANGERLDPDMKGLQR
jgi:deoxyribodipyrimidine photolyase-related protein